jgi:RNA-binding protein
MEQEPLPPRRRKQLRALAHHLEPVVQVGHAGVTDGVVGATSRALLDHELIKVRLYEPEDKRAMAGALATRTGATICGLLGHTVILYRRHPKRPRILPI